MKKKHPVLLLFLIVFFSACTTKYTVMNKGVGGNSSNDLLRRIEKDVLLQQPDLVIIMVGTNDMVNSGKMVSYQQFNANYQAIINRLKAQQVSLVLMSPPPIDTGYLFQRHKRSLFKEDPNTKIDSIATIIQQLALINQVHFIDVHRLFIMAGSPNRSKHSLIINQQNSGKEDGIHPTNAGYELITQNVFKYLKEKGLLRKNKKILCFGDSMTKGSFMVGEGTVVGETYPAYLQKFLEGKFVNK